MKLIIHIGSPKAGSSAIQDGLEQRASTLEKQGIACYYRPRALSTLYENLPPHHFLLQGWFETASQARAWSRHNWEQFESKVKSDRPRITLLSSEQFLNMPDLGFFLERLAKTFSEIHAVAYVRDPVSMFQSNLDQRIRAGARLRDLFSPWELANPMWIASSLDRYLSILGHDHFHVRCFDKSNLKDGDVIADYFGLVSRIVAEEIAPPEQSFHVNESLAGAATAWLLIVNETMANAEKQLDAKVLKKRRDELLQVIRETKELQALPRLRLDEPLVEAFLRHQTAEGCKHINRTFLKGQTQLGVGDRLANPPTPEELRRRTRRWIMSYLTPDLLELLSSRMLRVE